MRPRSFTSSPGLQVGIETMAVASFALQILIVVAAILGGDVRAAAVTAAAKASSGVERTELAMARVGGCGGGRSCRARNKPVLHLLEL